jgi:hypothetical protein
VAENLNLADFGKSFDLIPQQAGIHQRTGIDCGYVKRRKLESAFARS